MTSSGRGTACARRARATVAGGLIAVLSAVAAPLAAGAVEPSQAAATSAARGAAHLAYRQGDDGAVPARWRPDQVAEAIVALAAGGGQDHAEQRAVAFLEANADAGAGNGPYTGRIVSGVVAAGRDPRDFGGVDLVARLHSYHDPVSGGYGGANLYADALAMAGLLAAGEQLPDAAVRHLRLNQCDDGGWAHRSGCLGRADTDTTSLVTAVLARALGADAADVQEGRRWLVESQLPSGCWGLERGDAANANSCGLVLAAIAGLGEDPGASPWAAPGKDPVAALRGLQTASGGFAYHAGGDANDYATVQAVPGLAGWPQPLRPGLVSAHARLAGPAAAAGPAGGPSDGPNGTSSAPTSEAPAPHAARPPSPAEEVISTNDSAPAADPDSASGSPAPTAAGRRDGAALTAVTERNPGSGRLPLALGAAGAAAGIGAGGWWWRRRLHITTPTVEPQENP